MTHESNICTEQQLKIQNKYLFIVDLVRASRGTRATTCEGFCCVRGVVSTYFPVRQLSSFYVVKWCVTENRFFQQFLIIKITIV